jgi:hypothetical protein
VAKARAIQKYCDGWYLAIGDSSIVRAGELPPQWGLLVPSGDSMRAVVNAPKLDPQPLEKTFVAALLRRAARTLETPKNERDKIKKEGYDEGYAAGKDLVESEVRWEVRELKELKEQIEIFEKASGIKFKHWGMGDIGRIVKMIREHGIETLLNRAKRISMDLETLAEASRDNFEKYSKILEEL